MTSGVPALARAPGEAVTWQSAGSQGFPSSRCCPACSLRQPFAGVSLAGGAFRLGTIGQGPLHIWDGGGLARLALPGWPVSQLTRLRRPTVRAEYPREVPVSQLLPRPRSYLRVIPVSDARQVQTPARGASFPAPPTSPKLPPGDTRFRRPPGPNTRTRCQFPSSSHVPEVTPGWCPFPAPPGPNTRAKCQFPSSSHVPGVSSRWCPFPAVNEFLLLSRGAAQAPSENN